MILKENSQKLPQQIIKKNGSSGLSVLLKIELSLA